MDPTSPPAMMDAAAVATIGATTAILTQVVKRSVPGNIDAYGPLIAAVLAFVGVAVWVYSAPTFPPLRTDAWPIAAGWVSVFSTAVGVYESVKMATQTMPLRRRRPEPGTRVVDDPPVSTTNLIASNHPNLRVP